MPVIQTLHCVILHLNLEHLLHLILQRLLRGGDPLLKPRDGCLQALLLGGSRLDPLFEQLVCLLTVDELLSGVTSLQEVLLNFLLVLLF